MKKIILSLMINWRFLCKFHISKIENTNTFRLESVTKVNLFQGRQEKHLQQQQQKDKNREAFACFVAQNLKICWATAVCQSFPIVNLYTHIYCIWIWIGNTLSLSLSFSVSCFTALHCVRVKQYKLRLFI